MSAAERASEASRAEQANERAVRANEQASGPVLTSQFLPDLNHSEVVLDHSNSVFGGLQKCCKRTKGLLLRHREIQF